MTSTPDDPAAILAQLNAFSAADLSGNADARLAALALSRKLTASLEEPVNRAMELAYSVFPVIVIRTAIDLDLFSHLTAHATSGSGSGSGRSSSSNIMTTTRLAELSHGDPQLVERVLRTVASIGLIAQVSESSWQATATTQAMAAPGLASGHRYVHDMLLAAGAKAPKFLRENGFVAPEEPRDGIVQYAHQTKLGIFGLMESWPTLMMDFNRFMGSQKGSRRYWYDWCPVEEIVFSGFEDTSSSGGGGSGGGGGGDAANEKPVLMVDIGGGRGQDLRAFNARFPDRRGRLVLQDLAQVKQSIDKAEKNGEGGEGQELLGPKIEWQTYDHFNEQPVRGARNYLMHHILHQWSDKYCLQILANTRAAMRPGYSRLLINELVLPDVGPTPYQCALDVMMMVANGGSERSRSQWLALLEQAGFEDIKFWTKDEDGDGLIVAVA